MSKIYATLELDREEFLWLLAFTGSACTTGKNFPTPNHRIYAALYAADKESADRVFMDRFDGITSNWESINAYPLCEALIKKGIIK